tara:strand:- start:837 stop:1802 length:966 start_codon:yes stop_codon:yes gene_type:complete
MAVEQAAGAAAGAGISWGTLGIGALFSIGGSLLERRSQKRKMRRARRERAKMKEQAEQRSAEIGGAFESLIETRRLQMQADDPALRAARRTLVRQKQRSQQIRARSRQAGVSPDAIVELSQGANFEEYIGEKMQRLQEVQAGTAAIEQLTQAKTQAQSDVFKTGLGAQTQLLGQETQMMADMSDPWASFLGAMGTGFAEEALSGKPGEEGLGKTDPNNPLDPGNYVGSPSIGVLGENIMPPMTKHLGIQVQSGGSIPTDIPSAMASGASPNPLGLDFADMAPKLKPLRGSSLDKFGAGSMSGIGDYLHREFMRRFTPLGGG